MGRKNKVLNSAVSLSLEKNKKATTILTNTDAIITELVERGPFVE